MRLRQKIKSRIAAAMAAVMVFSMAAPALPVYAASRTIVFDTGDGPKVTDGPNHYTTNTITVNEGDFLKNASGFAGVPLVDTSGATVAATDTSARPVLPWVKGAANAPSWSGWTFDGWYDDAYSLTEPVSYLPIVMPSGSAPITYKAKWKSDGTVQTKTLTVMHYRMLDDSDTELPATASAGFYTADHIAFNPGGQPWVNPSPKSVGDTITEVPLSSSAVPGYTVKKVILKNYKNVKYGETSGNGTGTATVTADSDKTVSGTMPNDDLTIRYLYKPDDNQKFSFTREYVDASGATIKQTDSDLKKAEESISNLAPPTIAGFVYSSHTILQGQNDDANACVYGTTTLAGKNRFNFDTDGVLNGKMPNQNVKIRYTYTRDPAYQLRVQVKYRDNHGNPLDGQDGRPTVADINELRAVGTTGEQTVPVPVLAGYNYPPNWNPGTNGGATSPTVPSASDPNLKFTLQAGTDNQGAKIEFTYVENTSDATAWARVNYQTSANGNITGNTAPRSIRVGSYTWDKLIGEATGGGLAVSADPERNYMLEGWYVEMDGVETKIYDAATGTSTIPTADHKFVVPAGTGTPPAMRTLKIYPKFVKNPAEWYTLTFTNSAHGNLSGFTTLTVPKYTRDASGTWNQTTWADLNVPTATPDSGYYATPWTSSVGLQPGPTTQIGGSETYNVNFLRIGFTDDGVLAMPNASGSVANNGTGSVNVSSANALRNYAITDMSGNVIATLPGATLQTGAFTGLPVNAQYQVYELPTSENPAAGTPITSIPGMNRSQPTTATIPAVGPNASTGTDAANPGQQTITVSPTAPNTEYSLLDASGNVVPASGWVTPSTPGAAIVFDNLDPNTTYTVVARPVGGSQTPQNQSAQGTVIPVTGNPAATPDTYTLRLLNGGKVIEHKRTISGVEQLLPIGADDTNVTFQAGDKIKLDVTVPAGATTFNRWNVLLGSLNMSTVQTMSSPRVTMPAGSVTIAASFNNQPLIPAQPKADLDYTPKDGRFAPDPANNAQLLTELTNNGEDSAALANPSVSKLTYIVKLNRSAVSAANANELKSQTGDNDLKTPWSLQVGLARDVDGVNKTVPASNSNATMRVIARLDESLKNNTDYTLWKRTVDGAGQVNYVDVQMNPADLSAAGFDGNFSFEAKNGDYLVLSYKKAYTVTVIDSKRGTTYTFRVPQGGDIASHADYTNMRGALAANYTDPTTGIEYEFDQFRKANSQTAPTFADSNPVTRDMTIYAMYIPADDTAWQNARNNLIGEINRGNGVMTNPNIVSQLTPTELSDLTNAVTQANALANRIPRPTTAELVTEHANLKALIDAILARIAGITPAPAPTPTPTPTPGGGGGGSHGGGGGGGGGRGGSGRRGITGSTTSTGTGNRVYQNGVEGNWVNFDVENHGWYFDLGNGKRIKGTWADVAYTYDGQTKIYSYHFDENGVMDSGWWKNDQGTWFHLSTIHDGWFGSMDKGWYHDSADGRWYYLNLLTGAMMTGWQQIDGTWYYLNPVTPAPTWDWDASQNRWVYGNRPGRPYGSMYANEVTPDGYHVDASGAWIRETP